MLGCSTCNTVVPENGVSRANDCQKTLRGRTRDSSDGGAQSCFVFDLECVRSTACSIHDQVDSRTRLAWKSQALHAQRHQSPNCWEAERSSPRQLSRTVPNPLGSGRWLKSSTRIRSKRTANTTRGYLSTLMRVAPPNRFFRPVTSLAATASDSDR
jgi:hypothetical protein